MRPGNSLGGVYVDWYANVEWTIDFGKFDNTKAIYNFTKQT